jgi:hypothetical protein
MPNDKKTQTTCFYTSIAFNYIDKALAWAESVFTIDKNAHIFIGIIDYRWADNRELARLMTITSSFNIKENYLVFIDSLDGVQDIDEFAYKFDVVEACTAVKPIIAKQLFEKYDAVVYLDPDVIMYSAIPFLDDNEWDILLTPHIISPPDARSTISERMFMNFGIYNLGFFAIRKNNQTQMFLKWWGEFCNQYGDNATHVGLFVDQKPLDFAPAFLDRIKIIRHPGCNVAWWNLYCDNRVLSVSKEKFKVKHLNDSHDLIFYHFSNMDHSSVSENQSVSRQLKYISADGKEDSYKISYDDALLKLFSNYKLRCDSAFENHNLAELKLKVFKKFGDSTKVQRLIFSESIRRGKKFSKGFDRKSDSLILISSLFFLIKVLKLNDLKLSIKFILKSLKYILSPSLVSYTNITRRDTNS